jgi:hypothetical protein
MTDVSGLVAEIEADRVDGTPGPWRVPGAPEKICAMGYTKNGAAKTIATVNMPSWMTMGEPFVNARRIARVPAMEDALTALTAENARLRADMDWLKRSIFGSADYHPSLPTGCFAEMAQTTDAARKGALSRAEAAEAERDRLHAALSTVAAERDAAVKGRVKPLVWEDIGDCFWARDPYGDKYEVEQSGDYWIVMHLRLYTRVGFKSADEAKAAAQADYETRILAALHVSETPESEHEAGDVSKDVHTAPTPATGDVIDRAAVLAILAKEAAACASLPTEFSQSDVSLETVGRWIKGYADQVAALPAPTPAQEAESLRAEVERLTNRAEVAEYKHRQAVQEVQPMIIARAERAEAACDAALARVTVLEKTLRTVDQHYEMQGYAPDSIAREYIAKGLNAALTPPQEAAQAVAVAWRDVMAERQRQISAEGWTPEHDDGHSECELARAAATYALCTKPEQLAVSGVVVWPWDRSWWKPSDYRRNLVKSGALILAEIERLDRAHPPAAQEGRE